MYRDHPDEILQSLRKLRSWIIGATILWFLMLASLLVVVVIQVSIARAETVALSIIVQSLVDDHERLEYEVKTVNGNQIKRNEKNLAVHRESHRKESEQ